MVNSIMEMCCDNVQEDFLGMKKIYAVPFR